MDEARKKLMDAIEAREDDATVRSMALALAPRKPAEQITALLEMEDACGPRYAELEREARMVANELAKLDASKAAIRNIITQTMVDRGIKKVDTGYCTVSLSQGRESMKVADIDQVTDEFARMKREGDRTKAMAHLRETGVVPSGFDFHRGDPYITVRAKKNIR